VASGDLPKLLRNLLVLARRLKTDDLTLWVKYELEGYERAAQLPDYSDPFSIADTATYSRPMRMKIPVPVSHVGVPSDHMWMFETELRQPVAALEQLATGDQDLHAPWDPHLVGTYNNWAAQGLVARIESSELFQAHAVIPRSQVV